ncbi:MAG: M28 family peptidase, partial [bacterium]
PLWQDSRSFIVRLDEAQARAASESGWLLAALPRRGYPPAADRPAGSEAEPGDRFDWQPDTLVGRIVESLRLDPLVEDMRALEAFGTRYTYSPKCEEAALWLYERLVDLGWETELDTYYINSTRALNVEATLPGEVRPDSIVVVCAHFDSYSQQGMTSAPGADDNATGTAILLELARVLREYRFRWTVKLLAFSGEEQWMKGSYHWVDSIAVPQDLAIYGAFNVDMIGYTARDSNYLVVNRDVPSAPMAALAESTNRWYDIGLSLLNYLDPDCPGDAQPFWEAGYKGTFALEDSVWGIWRGSNPYYHTENDTVGTLTLGQVLRVGRLTAACLATVAVPTGLTGIAGPDPVGPGRAAGTGTLLFSRGLELSGRWDVFGADGRRAARGSAAEFGPLLAPGVYYLYAIGQDRPARRILKLR